MGSSLGTQQQEQEARAWARVTLVYWGFCIWQSYVWRFPRRDSFGTLGGPVSLLGPLYLAFIYGGLCIWHSYLAFTCLVIAPQGAFWDPWGSSLAIGASVSGIYVLGHLYLAFIYWGI